MATPLARRLCHAPNLVAKMLVNSLKPDGPALVSVVAAAAKLREPGLARPAHGMLVKGLVPWDPHIGSALVVMYGKCGCLSDACQVFIEMPERNMVCSNAMIDAFAKAGDVESAKQVFDSMDYRDIVSWNSLLGGYGQAGLVGEALHIFKQLLVVMVDGQQPNFVTFLTVVAACMQSENVELGKVVHALAVTYGLGSAIEISNALVDMYAKGGFLCLAYQVFNRMQQRDVVSWNTMLASFVRREYFMEALELFVLMRTVGCIKPDKFTMVSVIKACGQLKELSLGRCMHGSIEKIGMVKDGVLCNSLIDMYASCWVPNDAFQAFKLMTYKDLISWNTMLDCFLSSSLPIQALALFREMQVSECRPDKITMVTLASSCSQLGDACVSRCIHAYVIRMPPEADIVLYNSLITMYSRCGHIIYAQRVFDNIDIEDRIVSTWSAMIGGLATYGNGIAALKLFSEMQKVGPQPDDITFMEILSACRHSGLVDEGRQFFSNMTYQYNVLPTYEHYGCMVDLLGRAGQLEEAEELVRSMPMKPTTSILGALLGACRIYGNEEIAERIMKQLELKADSKGVCVLVSNIYAASSRWDRVKEVRCLMKKQVIKNKVSRPSQHASLGCYFSYSEGPTGIYHLCFLSFKWKRILFSIPILWVADIYSIRVAFVLRLLY